MPIRFIHSRLLNKVAIFPSRLAGFDAYAIVISFRIFRITSKIHEGFEAVYRHSEDFCREPQIRPYRPKVPSGLYRNGK